MREWRRSRNLVPFNCARPAGPANRPSSTIPPVVSRRRRLIEELSNSHTDSYVAKRGGGACGAMIQPKGMTTCCRRAVSNARNALRAAVLEPEEGFEPSTFQLRDGCSAANWTDPDGSSLLTLDGSSIQTARDGSRRIVWMIKRMIKCHPILNRMAGQAAPTSDEWPSVGMSAAGPPNWYGDENGVTLHCRSATSRGGRHGRGR
jgi:hypothetical protein